MTYGLKDVKHLEIMASLEDTKVPEITVAPLLKEKSPSGFDFQLLSLCSELREKGLEKEAASLEDKFLVYKQAASLYGVFKETGESLMDDAHPEGDVEKGPSAKDYGDVETRPSQQEKIKKIVNKEPTGKLASYVEKCKVALGFIIPIVIPAAIIYSGITLLTKLTQSKNVMEAIGKFVKALEKVNAKNPMFQTFKDILIDNLTNISGFTIPSQQELADPIKSSEFIKSVNEYKRSLELINSTTKEASSLATKLMEEYGSWVVVPFTIESALKDVVEKSKEVLKEADSLIVNSRQFLKLVDSAAKKQQQSQQDSDAQIDLEIQKVINSLVSISKKTFKDEKSKNEFVRFYNGTLQDLKELKESKVSDDEKKKELAEIQKDLAKAFENLSKVSK